MKRHPHNSTDNEKNRCIVCNSGKTAPNKIGLSISNQVLFTCSDCSAVFLAPWSTGFNPELYSYYGGRCSLAPEDIYDPLNDIRYKKLLAGFSSMAPGRAILDVGCGQGQFIKYANSHGWCSLGIELSAEACGICRRFGVPVVQTDVYGLDPSEKKFDFITSFEVLEHVTEPVRFIRRIEQLLNPGGVFYLTTPNYASLDRLAMGRKWRVFHQEHAVYYTPTTIRELINRYTGLKIEHISTRNISTEAISALLGHKPRIRKPFNACARPAERMLRNRIETSAVLRALKASANAILCFSGMGVSMTVMCRKAL